jgi:hypothetical protein
MAWPQTIMLGLMFLSICIVASKNGQPRDGHYDLGASLIANAISLALLVWGGFFA